MSVYDVSIHYKIMAAGRVNDHTEKFRIDAQDAVQASIAALQSLACLLVIENVTVQAILAEDQEREEVELWHCPVCNSLQEGKMIHCDNCGASFDEHGNPRRR